MSIHKKMIIYGVFILIILSLSFFAGCGKKQQKTSGTQETSDAVVISASELKSIANSGVINLTDDSCASTFWIPKAQNITLSEVTTWLQQAQPYKGKIPKSAQSRIFHGNIGPSALYISTSDKHEISIQPFYYLVSVGTGYKTCYLADVLILDNDGHKGYIQSSQLYNWLKNDKWKTEFKMKP